MDQWIALNNSSIFTESITVLFNLTRNVSFLIFLTIVGSNVCDRCGTQFARIASLRESMSVSEKYVEPSMRIIVRGGGEERERRHRYGNKVSSRARDIILP